MLRTIRFLLALALAASAALAYADPPARAGRLNYAAGAVSFAPAEAPDQWVGAVLNRPLTSGDRLWADRDSRAEFHIGSTAVRLAGQTSLDVLNLNDDTLQFRLAQGSANVRVRDLDPGDTVEIATPSGAVVIRQPGSYRVSVDPRSDTSRVAVNFGQAEVVTPAQSFTVPSGQAAVVPLSGSIAFEVAGFQSTDEFDRWSAERDRRHESVASTRYVSTHMTGYEDLDQYGTWRTLPEYGAVWTPTRVAPGWAPYRHGHWVWVSPWGWTWVDDAPWGFAPFHYGRWVNVHGHWAWAPGAIVRRPVYAPALVAFVGGPRWSVSVSSGPAVGWFPLGWREPYLPSYRASPAYVRNVNVTHVTNVTNITNITNINYVNRNNPQAVTVVPRNAFVSARPVAQSTVSVPRAELARAEVIRERSPAQPVRASFAPERPGQRPPATAATREVVAVSAPATPAARLAPEAPERGARAGRSDDVEPRVRVIGRERAEARRAERAAQQEPQPERTNAAAAPAKDSAPPAPAPAAVRATPTAPAPAVAARVAAPPAAAPPAAAAAPRPAPVPRTAEENRPREARNVAAPEAASGTPVERERAQARRDPPARAEAQADRADNARERRMQRSEQAAPQREVPRPAAQAPQPAVVREAPRPPTPAPQPQAAREAPRPAAQAPQPLVVREAPRPPTAAPQPQAARETPRPAAPSPQAAREAPRPAAQAQQAQGPRAQAPQQQPRQQDDGERRERRRSGNDS